MLGLLIALAACGDDGGRGESSDGKITVYFGPERGAWSGTLISQFEAETGIDVEVSYAEARPRSRRCSPRKARAPPPTSSGHRTPGRSARSGEESLHGSFPRRSSTASRRSSARSEGNWVGVSGRVRVIAYNPELVPETARCRPRSTALTDAAWKNKVGMGAVQRLLPALRHRVPEDRGRASGDVLARGYEGQRDQDVPEQRRDRGRRGGGRDPAGTSSTTTTRSRSSRKHPDAK